MAFAQIYGHESSINLMKRAVANNRVAHAYLFYGMTGVGKKTAALAFAKTLNCLNPVNFDACEGCASCRRFEHNNHPDIIEVRPLGATIKIRQIRDIQDQMQFRPAEGKARVIMIFDADRMTIESANALLKTLEEPAPGNVLVLTTARFYRLPMTILSRCQHVRFNPLTRETVSSFLQKEEGIDKETADRLAAASGGSIGKALEMRREDYIINRDEILDVLLSARESKGIDMLFFIGDMAAQPKSIPEKLGLMKTCFRDALVYRETAQPERLIHYDRADAVKTLGERLSGSDILKNIQAVDDALAALEANANKQLTLETMMFRLALK